MAVQTPEKSASQSAPAFVPMGHHSGKPPIFLGKTVIIVGSRSNAHLHLLSRSVSKAHALILSHEGNIYIRDLASREKTYVNGREVREAWLKDGDLVKIGSFIFKYKDGPNKKKIDDRPEDDADLEIDGADAPLSVSEKVMLIGRRPTCDVSLIEGSVSTAHAVIFLVGGKRFIRDLGSRTGTFVNGKPVHQQVLSPGDSIRVGETDMRYVLAGRKTAIKPAQDEDEILMGVSEPDGAAPEIDLMAEPPQAHPPRPRVRAEPVAISPDLAAELQGVFGSEQSSNSPERPAPTPRPHAVADEVPLALDVEEAPPAPEPEPTREESELEPLVIAAPVVRPAVPPAPAQDLVEIDHLHDVSDIPSSEQTRALGLNVDAVAIDEEPIELIPLESVEPPVDEVPAAGEPQSPILLGNDILEIEPAAEIAAEAAEPVADQTGAGIVSEPVEIDLSATESAREPEPEISHTAEPGPSAATFEPEVIPLDVIDTTTPEAEAPVEELPTIEEVPLALEPEIAANEIPAEAPAAVEEAPAIEELPVAPEAEIAVDELPVEAPAVVEEAPAIEELPLAPEAEIAVDELPAEAPLAVEEAPVIEEIAVISEPEAIVVAEPPVAEPVIEAGPVILTESQAAPAVEAPPLAAPAAPAIEAQVVAEAPDEEPPPKPRRGRREKKPKARRGRPARKPPAPVSETAEIAPAVIAPVAIAPVIVSESPIVDIAPQVPAAPEPSSIGEPPPTPDFIVAPDVPAATSVDDLEDLDQFDEAWEGRRALPIEPEPVSDALAADAAPQPIQETVTQEWNVIEPPAPSQVDGPAIVDTAIVEITPDIVEEPRAIEEPVAVAEAPAIEQLPSNKEVAGEEGVAGGSPDSIDALVTSMVSAGEAIPASSEAPVAEAPADDFHASGRLRPVEPADIAADPEAPVVAESPVPEPAAEPLEEVTAIEEITPVEEPIAIEEPVVEATPQPVDEPTIDTASQPAAEPLAAEESALEPSPSPAQTVAVLDGPIIETEPAIESIADEEVPGTAAGPATLDELDQLLDGLMPHDEPVRDSVTDFSTERGATFDAGVAEVSESAMTGDLGVPQAQASAPQSQVIDEQPAAQDEELEEILILEEDPETPAVAPEAPAEHDEALGWASGTLPPVASRAKDRPIDELDADTLPVLELDSADLGPIKSGRDPDALLALDQVNPDELDEIEVIEATEPTAESALDLQGVADASPAEEPVSTDELSDTAFAQQLQEFSGGNSGEIVEELAEIEEYKDPEEELADALVLAAEETSTPASVAETPVAEQAAVEAPPRSYDPAIVEGTAAEPAEPVIAEEPVQLPLPPFPGAMDVTAGGIEPAAMNIVTDLWHDVPAEEPGYAEDAEPESSRDVAVDAAPAPVIAPAEEFAPAPPTDYRAAPEVTEAVEPAPPARFSVPMAGSVMPIPMMDQLPELEIPSFIGGMPLFIPDAPSSQFASRPLRLVRSDTPDAEPTLADDVMDAASGLRDVEEVLEPIEPPAPMEELLDDAPADEWRLDALLEPSEEPVTTSSAEVLPPAPLAYITPPVDSPADSSQTMTAPAEQSAFETSEPAAEPELELEEVPESSFALPPMLAQEPAPIEDGAEVEVVEEVESLEPAEESPVEPTAEELEDLAEATVEELEPAEEPQPIEELSAPDAVEATEELPVEDAAPTDEFSAVLDQETARELAPESAQGEPSVTEFPAEGQIEAPVAEESAVAEGFVAEAPVAKAPAEPEIQAVEEPELAEPLAEAPVVESDGEPTVAEGAESPALEAPSEGETQAAVEPAADAQEPVSDPFTSVAPEAPPVDPIFGNAGGAAPFAGAMPVDVFSQGALPPGDAVFDSVLDEELRNKPGKGAAARGAAPPGPGSRRPRPRRAIIPPRMGVLDQGVAVVEAAQDAGAPEAALPPQPQPAYPAYHVIPQRKGLGARVLVLGVVMLILAAAAWFLIHHFVKPSLTTQGILRFKNISALTRHELERFKSEQQNKLFSQQVLLNARGHVAARNLPEGFLAVRNVEQLGRIQVLWPENDPSAMQVVFVGADAADPKRIYGLLEAMHVENQSEVDKEKSLNRQIEVLKKRLKELDDTRAQKAEIKKVLDAAPSAEQIRKLEDAARDAEIQYDLATAAVKDATLELKRVEEQIPAPGANGNAPATLPTDMRLAELQRNLEAIASQLSSARAAASEDADERRKALDKEVEAFQQAAADLSKGNPELVQYVQAVQQLQERTHKLSGDLIEIQQQHYKQLTTIKKDLDDQIQARKSELCAADKMLQELRAQQDLARRKYEAAKDPQSGTPELLPVALKEIKDIQMRIDAREAELGNDPIVAKVGEGLKELLNITKERLDADRRRIESDIKDQEAAFARSGMVEKLPEAQRKAAATLKARQDQINELRRRYAASLEKKNSESNLVLKQMEEQAGKLAQQIDDRKRQLAAENVRQLTQEQEQQRKLALEKKQAALKAAQEQAATARKAFLERNKALTSAMGKREELAAYRMQGEALDSKLANDEKQGELDKYALEERSEQLKRIVSPVKPLESDVTVINRQDDRLLYSMGAFTALALLFGVLVVFATMSAHRQHLDPAHQSSAEAGPMAFTQIGNPPQEENRVF